MTTMMSPVHPYVLSIVVDWHQTTDNGGIKTTNERQLLLLLLLLLPLSLLRLIKKVQKDEKIGPSRW